MPAAMPRQKRNGHPLELADDKCIRRRTKRRLDRQFPQVLQLRHLVQAAAADYSNIYLFHNLRTNSIPNKGCVGKLLLRGFNSKFELLARGLYTIALRRDGWIVDKIRDHAADARNRKRRAVPRP